MTTRYIFSNDCQEADQTRINIIAKIVPTDKKDKPTYLGTPLFAPNDPNTTQEALKAYITQPTNTEQYVANSNYYDTKNIIHQHRTMRLGCYPFIPR